MGCKGSRVQISALRPVKTNGSEISVAKPVANYGIDHPSALLPQSLRVRVIKAVD